VQPSVPEFDEIGYWSEVKLDILREYAAAYSKILSSRNLPHIYVDAFSGAGQHVSKLTGEFVAGSPLNALAVQPPFREYHFIDLNTAKMEHLQRLVGNNKTVHFYNADCSEVLRSRIFPTLDYKSYRRALCLLDPYGLHLNWDVIFQAGQLRTVDMFLNFPVMDINRNALWRNPDKVSQTQRSRMNAFWGDESWRQVGYEQTQGLFGIMEEKVSNEEFAQAFRKRLLNVAGFKRVPEPLPMRNSNAVVYYLFFASQVDVAEKIVIDIFNKYRNRGRS
jgi:three-Cys-motif partner protein